MRRRERGERWIQVEALCLCAELERRHGAVVPVHLDQASGDERLIAEARRILARQRGPSRRPDVSVGPGAMHQTGNMHTY